MLSKYPLEHFLYTQLLKPIFFSFDAEVIHNFITTFGENLENLPWLLNFLFGYQNPSLKKTVLGVDFPNPVGLAAGFDYNGHLAKVIPAVGFGFSTIGTVTAKPYPGNPGVRLARLPKSQSLLVNKGFKSEGAGAVARRLDQKNLTNEIIGISIGSSNLPEVNTIPKAIADYLFTFNVFRNKTYIKYFELNISCPNTAITEGFTKTKNFSALVTAAAELNLPQPIFVKMPNEIDPQKSDELVEIALSQGIRGFIFTNLVKNRNNPNFDKIELEKFKDLRGNFSGKPTSQNAKNLLAHTRRRFGQDVSLISTGGVFTPEDAIERFQLGADLIQLITGMIYEGPQLPGEINKSTARVAPRGMP